MEGYGRGRRFSSDRATMVVLVDIPRLEDRVNDLKARIVHSDSRGRSKS
jgi:hypothetical protein